MRPTRAQLAGPALYALAFALASCGGGERQDADEPSGRYRVEVTRASFPSGQKLAEPSVLEITVRNAESRRTVPNIAVTVRGFDRRLEGRGLADPSRPVFVLNGAPKRIGGLPETKEDTPEGGETTVGDTWALGPLAPGKSKTFRWRVTAVQAGPYRLRYRVSAGLDGKARAVEAGGSGEPDGTFRGTIDERPRDARIGDDGRSIVRGRP